MKISPFTPIFFDADHTSNGLDSLYIQTFAKTDKILIEAMIGDGENTPIVTINDIGNGKVYATLEMQVWRMNVTERLCFCVLTGMDNGIYSVELGGQECEPFKVTDDEHELAETTLIQYSNKDNKQRDDVVFKIDYVQYFFDYRVPGGFKDSGWSFGVSNEQFMTQSGYTVELYARESLSKALTLGTGFGVPIWMAEHLNRVLCCNYVYLDKKRYVRDGENVPEISQVDELTNSFFVTQMLRKVVTPDAELEEQNQISLRKVYDTTYREVEAGQDVKPLMIE